MTKTQYILETACIHTIPGIADQEARNLNVE